MTPQPTRQAEVNGTSFGILTAWKPLTTVRSVNTDAAAKFQHASPFSVNGWAMLPRV